jgi:hypothetical protein
VDLSTFIVAVFCLVDDRLKGKRIRQRSPAPKLSDAKVLTIEVVGEFLGLDTDSRPSTSSFGVTTASGSLPSARSIGPPSLARRPTSGSSRKTSGKSFLSSLPTTPPSRSWTQCPCRRVCSPEPTAVGVLRERPPLAKTRSSSRPSTA